MLVTSARNGRVQALRRLCRDAAERRAEGTCVIEGIRAALEHVRSAGPVSLALISPHLRELAGGDLLEDELRRALRDRPDDLLETSDAILASVADVRAPQGVLLVVPAPRHEGLPHADGPILLAWQVQDPGNAGALIRTAEAAGCAAFVLARSRAGPAVDPFSPRCLRGSAGSAFRIPVFEWMGEPSRLASALIENGFRPVATLPRGGQPPDEADLTGPCAFLVGSEGHGLPEELTAPPAIPVTIPLEGAAESLNAAVAAAVIAFEAARQRRA